MEYFTPTMLLEDKKAKWYEKYSVLVKSFNQDQLFDVVIFLCSSVENSFNGYPKQGILKKDLVMKVLLLIYPAQDTRLLSQVVEFILKNNLLIKLSRYRRVINFFRKVGIKAYNCINKE